MGPQRRSTTLRRQDGFTLVELLVVIVIVGVLAAIALPAFLNQRTKGQDAEAKVYLVTVQKAFETWHIDHGTYVGATAAELERIEPSLAGARNLGLVGAANSFDASLDSAAGPAGGGRFTLARQANSTIVRTCTNASRGACSPTNTW